MLYTAGRMAGGLMQHVAPAVASTILRPALSRSRHWRSAASTARSRGLHASSAAAVRASAGITSPAYHGPEWSGGKTHVDDPLFDLTGNYALITGAAGAVGSRAALALARHGADVALADVSSRADVLSELAAQITGQLGRRAAAVTMDVTSADSVSKGVEQAASALGGLTTVVTCHGSLGTNTPPEAVREEEWARVLGINLDGVFRVCREAYPYLSHQEHGKVVIMGSIAGQFGYAHQAPYCAAKAGLVSMSKALAQAWCASRRFSTDGVRSLYTAGSYPATLGDLAVQHGRAKHNIQVNVIQPGALNTMFTAEVLEDHDKLAYIVERIPAGRLGVPDDIIGAILFLASRASDYVTGTTLTVDGGGTSRAMAKF